MTMPDIAAAVATAPATDTNGAAPVFAVGLPPLTEMPDRPQLPDMPAQLFDFVRAISVLADYYIDVPGTVVLGNCYLAAEPGSALGSLYPDCCPMALRLLPSTYMAMPCSFTAGPGQR